MSLMHTYFEMPSFIYVAQINHK